jgi:tetratricopeptide (TPR) repeat protein/2-polyprenyl-3-methyl-5-hydroxy-6-metoxy-1,4-benzoquinol methylase
MSDLKKIRMEVTDAAVDDELPLTAGNSAHALVDEGNALEEQGRTADAMARYDAAAQMDPRCARAHLNRGNVLLANARIDEARVAYEMAIACDTEYAAAYFNLGNLNCHTGDFERALNNYRVATGINPEFANAFVAMGNVLDHLGRGSEATENYERALAIEPGYAEVHFNLGVLAANDGRYQQAVESLRRAIGIRPKYGAAHYTLGKVLTSLGHLDQAEANFRDALSIAPESEAAVYELAMVLLLRSKSPEAVALITHHLERMPTWLMKSTFAMCIARTKFLSDDPLIRAALTIAITEPWGLPYELARPAISLIILDQRIASYVRYVNENWPARAPKKTLFAGEGLTALATNSLLLALLKAAPVSSVELERFLTSARYALLEAATAQELPDELTLRFYAALTQQCFINEYIFDCDVSEQTAAATCRTKLLALLDADAVIPPLLLLAVAAYFPLDSLPTPGRLLATHHRDSVEEVLRLQVREPLEEQTLHSKIRCLTSITHGVSEKVRDQYEQNPYPRWVKLPVHPPTLHFNAELRRTLPFARFAPLRDDKEPEVLVAGCGTGIHPITFAQRFRGARILAIDLSLKSISYAVRKTRELGVTNIEYAQADILKIGEISRSFDVISSAGVLHHLADPFAGWRILLSRLRPGGFMHLGFYSQLARRHVASAREFIAARDYGSSPDEIRRFRRDLAAENGDLQLIRKFPDFYSSSECRDLVFHVQEHRLTLAQIDSFLSESGLQFVGFELNSSVRHQYRMRFTGDPAGIDLHNWAQFEADNPDTFAGMYQFWIQRPITD